MTVTTSATQNKTLLVLPKSMIGSGRISDLRSACESTLRILEYGDQELRIGWIPAALGVESVAAVRYPCNRPLDCLFGLSTGVVCYRDAIIFVCLPQSAAHYPNG